MAHPGEDIVPSNPDNGTKRFEDFVHRVEAMDSERSVQLAGITRQLTDQTKTLASIETLLGPIPCRVETLRREVDVLTAKSKVSVARITGISSTIAAIITAIGFYFATRGGG